MQLSNFWSSFRTFYDIRNLERLFLDLIELEFTCLTPTIETPEQCAKMFKCDNKDITWFRYLYFKLRTNFTLLYPGRIKLIPDN